MRLVEWALVAYCISFISVYVDAVATTCHSCSSAVLKYNWGLTGLPAIPQNDSFFENSDCSFITQGTPGAPCTGGLCFFGAYATSQEEYVVVRSCVDHLIGESGITPPSAAMCDAAKTTQSVYVGKEYIKEPLVGWYVCDSDNCNNSNLDKTLATTQQQWAEKDKGDGKCSLPISQAQCVSCKHFDGEGRCYHRSKSLCQGRYCTKSVGKLNGRWFEIRGCAQLASLSMLTCLSYQDNFVIEQLGDTLRQSYWATTCTCSGERCNISTREILSTSILIFSAMFSLFKSVV